MLYLNFNLVLPGINLEYFFENNTSVFLLVGSNYHERIGFSLSMRYYYNIEKRLNRGKPLQRHSGVYIFGGVGPSIYSNSTGYGFFGGWGAKQQVGKSPWYIGGELGMNMPIHTQQESPLRMGNLYPRIWVCLGLNLFTSRK